MILFQSVDDLRKLAQEYHDQMPDCSSRKQFLIDALSDDNLNFDDAQGIFEEIKDQRTNKTYLDVILMELAILQMIHLGCELPKTRIDVFNDVCYCEDVKKLTQARPKK